MFWVINASRSPRRSSSPSALRRGRARGSCLFVSWHCQLEARTVRERRGVAPLLPGPPGLALAEEGRDALARVLGAERCGEAGLLRLDPLVQIGLRRDLL